ncbi:MAG: ribbon-helix-helix domain-containing protein [Desulfovibrio sp.]|nr:ribbon-helix-helix domain-containing protein [Desulfovibrio sp.]
MKTGPGGRRPGAGRKRGSGKPPEEQPVITSVRLPPDLIARLDAQAEQASKSRHALIVEILSAACGERNLLHSV